MFLADGGGGGTSSGPTYAGPQTLEIDAAAIPAALAAFQTALDKVSQKVDQLNGLTVRPWAQDEVSSETAMQFAQRTYGGGADSAIECLTRYQRQLANVCIALKQSQAGYTNTDDTSSARLGSYD